MIDIAVEPDQRRDFKGLWLPSELVLDENLNPFEAVLLAHIDSYDSGRGCWMAHDKLAAKLHCSTSHVSNTIGKLVRDGYLIRLKLKGRPQTALRVFYSRYRGSNGILRKVSADTEKSIPQILRKVSSKSTSSNNIRSHAVRPGDCFKEVTPSNAEKICQAFVKFTIQNRLYLGKTGSTSNGWTKDTIQKWNGVFRDLLSQTDYHEILDVLEWYRFHFTDEYVPRVASAITFCQRFTDIQRAMKRSPDRSIPSQRPSASTVILPDGSEVPFDEYTAANP